MLRYSALYYLMFCKCWTQKDETDALWRIYNYDDNAIRISTTINNFKKLKDIHFEEVKYVEKFNWLQVLDKSVLRSTELDRIAIKAYNPFFIKRTAFEHEHEVRMIYFHRFSLIPILNLYQTNIHSAADWNTIIRGFKLCYDVDDKLIVEEYKKILDIYLSTAVQLRRGQKHETYD